MFRPCIDIHEGEVKQIVGASLTEKDVKTNFKSERPSTYFAQMYKKDNLKGGHVIMLGRDRRNKKAAIQALRAYPGGMQVGGGIDPSNAKEYLERGASHVIVTSYVFKNGHIDFERLKILTKTVGKDRLVLDLSCRRRNKEEKTYYVVTDRWQKFTDFAVTKSNLDRLATFCDEFLVHGVDVEGTKTGIDEDLVILLGKICPIPVTYAGGAKDLSDLDRVMRLGHGKVALTIGSALDIFGGKTKYSDCVDWHRRLEDKLKGGVGKKTAGD